MTQVSWRAEEALVERVRKAAADHRRSMNDYITMVLEAATNPDLAHDEYTRIREKLARVDLVVPELDVRMRAELQQHQVHASEEEIQQAMAAAGRGTSLSDIVSEGRGG
ncbi:hypothetical protein JOF56_001110 [Kibdelosporangium banguiense]|uniref:Arc family DNA-binding protein n=1 Tax=Kibdelosporangium banguiense TaxID=1365924 RepID=A0ABS4T8H3_9PSEU|nr:transcriptional regulator [Kibdelosporangium banguiense]MBP2320725.1 hypothetical protein [Kibdelosporangium banguiense]